MLSSLHVLVQAIILGDVCNNYPHVTNGEMGAQCGLVTHQSWEGTKLSFKTRETAGLAPVPTHLHGFSAVCWQGLSEGVSVPLIPWPGSSITREAPARAYIPGQ